MAGNKKITKVIPKEILLKDYLILGLSIQEIAQKRKTSKYNIRALMEYFDIPKKEAHAPSLKIDPDDLERMYVKEDIPIDAIAEYYQCTKATIHNYLNRLNIPLKNKVTKPSKEELHEAYIKNGLTVAQCGDLFGASPPTMRKWLKEEGLFKKNKRNA